MTQSALFEKLGAPLANVRWSWGAIRSDGALFLRVWKDRIRERDDARWVQVTHRNPHDADAPIKPGHRERLEHVSRVQAGAPCYLLICEAEDVDSIPRRVKSFDQERLFKGGRMVKLDGEDYVELITTVPVAELAKQWSEGQPK